VHRARRTREHFQALYRVLGTGVEGSGLGLSIVREIAAAHGAIIELSQPKHKGGRVVDVTFPARPAAP